VNLKTAEFLTGKSPVPLGRTCPTAYCRVLFNLKLNEKYQADSI